MFMPSIARPGRRAVLLALTIPAFLFSFHIETLFAQDWSQWRGPGRDGVAAEVGVPDSWPDELRRVWTVEVGEGYSSPVVAGDRVFLLSREGGDEVVRALSLADGTEIWRQAYPAPYNLNRAARSHGLGPKSTPAFHDGHLYTLGISGILSCLSAGDGSVVWQTDFSEDFDVRTPIYGAATSPMVVDGVLIVHLGGNDDGALMALDPATGSVRWRLDGDGPGYTSPIVVELGGVRQIVTQTDKHNVGVSLGTGELLWQTPFTTPYVQNIVTPLLDGERLIFSGLEQATFAVEVERGAAGWQAREIWRNDRLPMYMSSPVLLGGRIFGMTHRQRGQLFAMDPDTGEAFWTSEGRIADNAALVVVDGQLLVLTSGAELLVLDSAADTYRPVARYNVADSSTYAHPVPTSEGILIKDGTGLSLWRW